MPSSTPTNAGYLSQFAAWFDAFFRSKGFTGANLQAADAGALGNLLVESNANPAAYNPNENAHSVAQWEGGRWTAMQALDARLGLSTTSVAGAEAQLASELNGPYSGVVNTLRGVTDPKQAAEIWWGQYEGASPASLPQRQTDASAVYSWLGGQAGGITGLLGYGVSVPAGAGAGSSSASSDPNQAPALPYKLGSLTGNLTGAQRTGIINYLEAVGNAPAAIGYWLRDNVAGAFGHTGSLAPGLAAALNAGNLTPYEQSGAGGNAYDQALEQAYNAIGAGGGVGYGAGHLSYQWHMPGSGILGDVTGAVENALTWVAKPIVKWLLAAALVVAGLVFVYLAVKMLGDTDSASPAPTLAPSSSTSKDDEEAETPRDEGAGVDAEGGEIAAAAA